MDLVLARARRARTPARGSVGIAVPPSRESLIAFLGCGASSGWLNVTTSPVMPRPVGPTIGGVGVVDDDRVLALLADAGAPVPGQFHGPILAQATRPGLTAATGRRAARRNRKDRKRLPNRRLRSEGGRMEPVRVSVPNTRPARIQQRASERLRNAHLDPGRRPRSGPERRAVAECRAMTSTPRRSAGLRGPPLLIVVAVLAACGQATPTASPAATSSSPSLVRPVRGPERLADRRLLRRDGLAAPRCGEPRPASDPNAALYTSIEGQVTQLRGLQAKTPVERDVLDHAQLVRVLPEDVLRGEPARAREGDRAALQGPAADAGGRVADGPRARDAHEPGRGPVRRPDEEDVRGLRHGRDRPARGDHLRPRVHARAPGPDLRARARSRARRRTRATGRWPAPR